MKHHPLNWLYRHFFKRVLDIICALLAMILFFWLYAAVGILVKIKLGSPVIFKQVRPGKIDKKTGKERLFVLYKFRTMTNQKDNEGNLLPDEIRLTKFGAWLRSTSLDEIPEVINILKGDMSVIGPRPQLVRDMVFMTREQRERHKIRPGLTGLAQINGRNAINWDEKFSLDLRYIEKESFFFDIKVFFKTVLKVVKRENITEEGKETAEDYGDYLLRLKYLTKTEWEQRMGTIESVIEKGKEDKQDGRSFDGKRSF